MMTRPVQVYLFAALICAVTFRGYADVVTIPDAVFSSNIRQPAAQQHRPQEEQRPCVGIEDPRQRIACLMIKTDLADNPEKLMKLANIAAIHGVTDGLPPFAAMAQKAKRRAEIKTFQSLMLGNVDGAIDAAKLSGSPFADRPVKIKPNDPNDFAWKILQEGGAETVVNVKTMFELYSQIAQSEDNDLNVASERQAIRKEREARQELMEEQKRALSEQRRRSSTEDLRDRLLIDFMLAPGRF